MSAADPAAPATNDPAAPAGGGEPAPFHGSYAPGDVRFLLKPLQLAPIADVREKERLIQSGARHYSEIIGAEHLPGAGYLALFHQALAANASRMARDVHRLARCIHDEHAGAITLVSLARAGTPVGVLLRRTLAECFGRDAPHYSVSIIRDRGIDATALDFIRARHADASIVFVDGWTGKGTIAAELRGALRQYHGRCGADLPARLHVLCDLAGVAHAAGSADDYLVPSGLLNATVSGLVSRTILNEQVGPGDFHGCLHYKQWAEHDLSGWFVDRIMAALCEQRTALAAAPARRHDASALQARSEALVAAVMQRHGVHHRNFVKPGLGEATRAMLRRVPRLLLLRDPAAPEVAHLCHLAVQNRVSIHVDPALPLHAVAIIERLSDA